jgi:hypothetical protein
MTSYPEDGGIETFVCRKVDEVVGRFYNDVRPYTLLRVTVWSGNIFTC